MFYVYILTCKDGNYYTGCTLKLKERLERHNKGEVSATRDRLPVKLEAYITFLDKYSPEQFEILSSNDIRLNNNVPLKDHGLIKDKDGTIDGKPKYVRIVIKHKRDSKCKLN